MTINEALIWQRTLKERHTELVGLRNENSRKERRFYGASADKEIVHDPVYDVKVLDKMIATIAKEMRVLDMALKATNAVTQVQGYNQNDAVLGELS